MEILGDARVGTSVLPRETELPRDVNMRIVPDDERREGDISWESLALHALGLWLITRVGLVLFGVFALLMDLRHSGTGSGLSAHVLIESWDRWDATKYVFIANHGYTTLNDVVFFPLYPLLIRIAELIVGSSHGFIAGMLVNNLGSLFAFVGLVRLAMAEGCDRFQARMSALAFAAWPLAFFLVTAYSEGVFVACAVWCLWAMRKGSWYLAAGCAFFAALTRPTGIILFAPLVFEFARQHGVFRAVVWHKAPQAVIACIRPHLGQFLVVLGAVPVAITIYSVYCGFQWGDALAWQHAQTLFSREQLPLWSTVLRATRFYVNLPVLSTVQAFQLVDLLALLFVIGIGALGIRRLPLAYVLYLAGLVYLTIADPRVVHGDVYFGSAGRFMLAAVPVFLLVGKGSRRWPLLVTLLLFVGILAQAVLTFTFIRGDYLV